MRKREAERIDDSTCFMHITNESNRLPGHKDRMKAHCERVAQELKKRRKRKKRKKWLKNYK